MRRWIILFTLALLTACAPPHPTHPTRVECRVLVEASFTARFDTTPPSTIEGREDPCLTGGFGTNQEGWLQTGPSVVAICMAAGTTPEQAASACSSHLAGGGIGAPPPSPLPPVGGRICPGSIIVLSNRIVGSGGSPVLKPNECREGTTLPLR